MHQYYKQNTLKLQKKMDSYLKLIRPEVEEIFGKPYRQVFTEIWNYYEQEMLEYFPFIGGDGSSGTKNLTGCMFFVALGVVSKRYGLSTYHWGRLATTLYERHFDKIPRLLRRLIGGLFNCYPNLVTKALRRKDRKNAANAAKNPGTTVPVCTGEDIYLKENFLPLLQQGGVSVIHPDILTCGGALELKKIGDLADEYGVAVAIHMAESPVGCMAAVQTAAALNHVLAVELHSVDVPWWADMVTGIPKPLVNRGFIRVPEKPGLGFDSLNEEVIREHINPNIPGMWEPTDAWNREFANDRIWS